jgi:alanine dehydrogenase
MPGTYPRSATDILTESTLPYITTLADVVHKRAVLGTKSFSDIDKLDSNFKKGVYVHGGKIINLNVAESLDLVEYYE